LHYPAPAPGPLTSQADRLLGKFNGCCSPEPLTFGNGLGLAQLPKVAPQATGLDATTAKGVSAGADPKQQGGFLGAEGGTQFKGVA